MAEIPQLAETLVPCSRCGSNDVRHEQYAVLTRMVHGRLMDGTLVVGADYQVDDVLYAGTGDLVCQSCFHREPVAGMIHSGPVLAEVTP